MPDSPAASSPSSQGDTLPDVQHAVIMNKLWPIKQRPSGPKTVLKVYFWEQDCTQNKKNAVRTTIMKSARDKARDEYPPGPNNPFDFETWEDHANIEFKIVKSTKNSDIRIIFTGKRFCSAVGTDARDDKDNTHHSMQLGPLKDRCPPTEYDRGAILHEFGHALGLDHEHQGPAARQLLKLNRSLIEKHYEDYAHSQVLDGVEDSELWNYTNFDPTSIMIYRLDEAWQEQETKYKIGEINELSKIDQASIKLLYPPDLTKSENHGPFKDALTTVGVNEKTAGKMIADFVKNPEDDAAARLTNLRNRFSQWKMTSKGRVRKNTKWLPFYNPNVDVLRYIDPTSLKRSGINQFAGEVTKNKLFQSIMKIIVYRTMVQRGIPTNDSIPGATETEVTKLIAALSVHDNLGQLIKEHRATFSGENDNGDRAVTTTTEPLQA